MADPTAPTPCRVCAAPVAAPFALCYCCDALVRQLQMPLVPVVAVAEYRLGDDLHRRLRAYKDSPVAEDRAACTEQLAAMLGAWLVSGRTRPGTRLGRWDVVATVPSSRRPAGAPVDAVVAAVAVLAARHRPLLTRGTEPTGHLQAARRGFALGPGVDPKAVAGLRVLLVDDCVVTGARAQSAAAALRLRGARVCGRLALGSAAVGPEGPPLNQVWPVTRTSGPPDVLRYTCLLQAVKPPGSTGPGAPRRTPMPTATHQTGTGPRASSRPTWSAR